MDVFAVTIIFLLLTALSSAETQFPKLIQNGSTLYPTKSPTQWLSPSGQFAFGFYGQGSGFAVGIWLVEVNNNTVVWTANRDDPPVTSNAKLRLTEYGKLVLQTEQGQEKLIADTNATASSASMLDSGNLVLYDKSSNIIWQSFDYPTDTIVGGQTLPSGGQLLSSSSQTDHSTGRFHLKMQEDGNLVLYPLNTGDNPVDAYWNSVTPIYNGFKYYLYLNETGTLLIRNHSNSVGIFDLYRDDASLANNINNEKKKIFRATLGFDGIFRLYVHFNNGSSSLEVKHWPPVDNSCQVKGFCGFNSYCTFNDDQPYCNCLPGFDFVEPTQRNQGCKRNFTEAECKGEKDDKVADSYNIEQMKNIDWGDRPYFDAEMSHEEDCSSSCKVDCNCWAGRYKNGRCQKQNPPLRYVVRTTDSDAPSVAFLKVGNESLKNWNLNHIPLPSPPPPSPIKSTSNKAIVRIILVTSSFALLLCSTIAICIHYVHKFRVLRYKRLLEIGGFGLNEEVTLRRFSYNELKRATNDFKQELGKGSFGAVYKGALYKGRRLIAVKRLEKLFEEGEREFQAEMRAIGKTHHRNLVRLLGYCAEGSKRLLVYEYMSNGSLAKLLFGGGSIRRPDWDERVRIALDIARGMLYLHEECEAPIIHCDIKPQNILMDEFWTAKISDFGLAKLLMPDQTRTFTGVRGTRGYLAPEWQKNTPISVKADVYSYGMVLLEIVCCRRNMEVNVSQPEEILLSAWAYRCFVAGELNKLVLWEYVDRNMLENMVKVAFWCIQDEPFLRPTMKSVVLMLEGITDIAIPPCPNDNSM